MKRVYTCYILLNLGPNLSSILLSATLNLTLILTMPRAANHRSLSHSCGKFDQN